MEKDQVLPKKSADENLEYGLPADQGERDISKTSSHPLVSKDSNQNNHSPGRRLDDLLNMMMAMAQRMMEL